MSRCSALLSYTASYVNDFGSPPFVARAVPDSDSMVTQLQATPTKKRSGPVREPHGTTLPLRTHGQQMWWCRTNGVQEMHTPADTSATRGMECHLLFNFCAMAHPHHTQMMRGASERARDSVRERCSCYSVPEAQRTKQDGTAIFGHGEFSDHCNQLSTPAHDRAQTWIGCTRDTPDAHKSAMGSNERGQRGSTRSTRSTSWEWP
jgi:hypothetical protein